MKQLGGILALGIALALSACDRAPETPSTDAEAAVAEPAAAAPPAGTSPATSAAEPAAQGPARLDGYGPLTLGSSLEDVRSAWKEPPAGRGSR